MHVRLCVWVPERVGVCMRISAYSLANPSRNAYAPYRDVASRSTLYFSTLFHKRCDFRENVIEHKMFLFSLQLFSTRFLVLRRIQRCIVKNVETSLCKVPVICVRFYLNLNFLNRLSKKPQISSLIKIRPVGAELFHADRRT